MTDVQQSTFDADAELEAITQRALDLVPVIREYSAEAERNARIPDALIDRAREAGLFDALVPRRWGGQEQGMAALWTCGRVLAHGDMSAAWVLTILMEYNWFACRMPLEAQEELYADRNYVLAGSVLTPSGQADRVDGGYNLSGRWFYGSGVLNSDWFFISGMVSQDADAKQALTFLVPTSELKLHDDWNFAGMSATGSCSFSCEDVFVPERRVLPLMDLISPSNHPGATLHEDPIHRYSGISVSVPWCASIAMGGAERALELGRDRLFESKIFGTKRVDQALSRVRWAEAHQLVRCARLLFDKLVADTVAHGEGDWSLPDSGQQAMDGVTVVNLCKDAVRLILDGAGSSAYHRDNELQRYFRDMHVVANHVQNDWDNATERTSRYMLGLPIGPGDPFSEAPAA